MQKTDAQKTGKTPGATQNTSKGETARGQEKFRCKKKAGLKIKGKLLLIQQDLAG